MQEPEERMPTNPHDIRGRDMRIAVKGRSNIGNLPSRQIRRAFKLGENTQRNTLAALALKEDTIP